MVKSIYKIIESVYIMQQKNTLLTEGPVGRKIIAFALPLFLGNLFQQLYNTADSLIVGNFLGSDALAAVSSSGSLIFLMVGFFNGISMGAGVVTARYFGAKDEESVEKSIHTTITFGIFCGVLLTLIGMLLAPQILVWMGTPENVLPSSISYFRIYFAGSIAFVLYNIFVGILQSVGDSKRPLIYLMISSVTNVILDLLFITVFHMGVGSAALATIISQFLSAALCLIRLMRTQECYRVSLQKLRVDRVFLRQIIANGLPAGLQNSIISIANVVVQANINVFGPAAMAGCGSYFKIEGFGFLPITCFALALTTFVSQNIGAGNYDRVRKGARFGILCSILSAEVVGIFIYLMAPLLIAGFNRDAEVIAFGTTHARIVTLFYFLLAFSHCLAGIFRGAGKATVPMFVMLACWCIIRVSYITIAVKFLPQLQTISWAYPITWCLSTIVFLIYYKKANWLPKHSA